MRPVNFPEEGQGPWRATDGTRRCRGREYSSSNQTQISRFAMIHACIEMGLEPKLCLGAEKATGGRPAVRDQDCSVAKRADASFVSVTTRGEGRALPACVRSRVIVATDKREFALRADAPAPEAVELPLLPGESGGAARADRAHRAARARLGSRARELTEFLD